MPHKRRPKRTEERTEDLKILRIIAATKSLIATALNEVEKVKADIPAEDLAEAIAHLENVAAESAQLRAGDRPDAAERRDGGCTSSA